MQTGKQVQIGTDRHGQTQKHAAWFKPLGQALTVNKKKLRGKDVRNPRIEKYGDH